MDPSAPDFFVIDTIGGQLDDEGDLIYDPNEGPAGDEGESSKPRIKKIDFSRVQQEEVDKILSKATLTPDFDKLAVVDAMAKSTRQQKLGHKRQCELTAGRGWSNMPKAELTDEKRRDAEVIQMRGALDPKTHYRRKDRNVLPKYFEMGHIVDDPAQYYSSRMTKKERKRTIVEELMQDVELVAKAKQRYTREEFRKKRKRKT